jgi:GTP-binding protein
MNMKKTKNSFIRNVAIIAHVDHGKTTLVDGLLKQAKTFRENEAVMSQELIMDSNDQERERGITILAKNTAVTYKDIKINIIDTPGHADFGGEVERTLNMADGVLLLVDAQEGPMPQTKFVLKKALELGLKVIVVVNKIDKKDARVEHSIHKVHDLFLELATQDSQLDFPVVYAIGREGKAWANMPDDFTEKTDLAVIFDAIVEHVPAPESDIKAPFQMLVTTLDWDTYKGKYAIGRIKRGKVTPGMPVVLLAVDGTKTNGTIEKIFVSQGLKRIEATEGVSGDIVAITGIQAAHISDTIAHVSAPEALPVISIEEPTLSMSVGPNTSPFMGKEGKFVTSRQILERIERELQTNVAMKFAPSEDAKFIISGRGELHLSVFLETLRREGFELEVGKPKVITKIIDGVECEPLEQLSVDVENGFVGAIKNEIGRRRGILVAHEELTTNMTRLVFEITTRAMLGFRGMMLTLSKGTAVAHSTFLRYEKMGSAIQKLRKGVLVAFETGKTAPYGMQSAQERGALFIFPQMMVYEGMIVGLNCRDDDMEVNVCKEKHLTNFRSVGEDAIILTPPIIMSLEQSIGFLEDDELLEITPTSLRLRKKILNTSQRRRAVKKNSD